MQTTETALLQSVPLMHEARALKLGYNELPINTAHPLFNESLVKIVEYGISGQAYYSRPNAATGESVPGVSPDLYVRRSVAETLARINEGLEHPYFQSFFGHAVELYVEDALRPVSLQQRLYDEFIPALLYKNHPEINEEEMALRRKDIIALPSTNPSRPSPHATGGVLDVILRYRQNTKLYMKGTNVPMGHSDADTSDRINPDYFEYTEPKSDEDRLAQGNRRAYYAIMTGAAFGFDSSFVNNPTEWWHWGRGDQLSAKVSGEASAYYSLAEPDRV